MSTTTYTDNVIGEADYHGKRYALLWRGSTKYGEKGKLAFRDLSKSFWVPDDELENVDQFPEPVDLDDYTRGNPVPQKRVRIESRSESQEREEPEAPSYCAHCGQLIK